MDHITTTDFALVDIEKLIPYIRVCSTTTPRIKHQRIIGQLNRESASIWQKDQDKET